MELSLLAQNVRTLIRWIATGLLGLFFVWLLWLAFSFTFSKVFPPPPDQADQALGKVSRPFENSPANKDVDFDLDIPGDEFPATPVFMPVYVVPAFKGQFDSLDKASTLARGAGLDSTPIKLNEPIWRWTSATYPNQNLKYNIVTGNFNYNYDWVADSASLEGTFRTTDEELVLQANRFLNNFKALNDDLKAGDTRVSYFSINGSQKNKVGSLSEANATLVEYFRKKINFEDIDYPVVDPNSNISSVNVLMSPSREPAKQLLELNYTYWSVDFNDKGTYNLKSPSQAYQELTEEGKAFVASGNLAHFKQISITKIYLAYFNPIKETRFFQPVYVFEGRGLIDNNTVSFSAYVPAILDDFLK